MVTVLYKGILVAIFLICGTFSILTIHEVLAEELVTVTSTNHAGVTVVEYKNNDGNIFDIKSIVLEIDQGGNFKSFKTEKGWMGKRTSDGTITFTSTTPIKPGQSAKFGIKTDKPEPSFKWKAYDEEGDELGAGGEIITSQPKEEGVVEDTSPKTSSGVLDGSTFKIIPSTPKVDTSLRVIGEGFAPREKLDFYIDSNQIDSVVSDEKGNFILSTKIPESQKADRADFIIKDQAGNQKSMSLRIQESSNRPSVQNVELSITGDKVFHRGDEKVISGTAEPGITLTISLSDSGGQVLTTFTDKADNQGKYSINHRVPIDRLFGEYTIAITDGKSTVSHTYTVETTQKIVLTPLKQKYEPGEIIVINGTALPDQEIEIIIEDPVGMEVYSKNMIVGPDGIVNLEYPLEGSAREGTYVIFATQGDQHETFLVGVGELPQIQLVARMSATNYKTSDRAILYITGPPSSTISLIIVDPSDKQKFADTITIGIDGYYEYGFNLSGYSPGVYTAVLSRGNTQVEERFLVGLDAGSGPITLRTIKDAYYPGETILIIGEANPNTSVTVIFKDPNGTEIRSEPLFTNKEGIFSSNAFRFPIDAKPGIWVLDAASRLNHAIKEITLLTSTDSGLTVWVDKNPPTYDNAEKVTITGMGAGISHSVVIDILGADQTKIQSLSIGSTGTGGFSTVWEIPKDLAAGTYTIKVTEGIKMAEITITVQ